MKFFFADNMDCVDAHYDFERDLASPNRVPQVDDLYAHQVFERPPYDGILISRGVVGFSNLRGRYSDPQRFRLMREGVRAFLRYGYGYDGGDEKYPVMGDCGSFSYVEEKTPLVKNEETIEYYEALGVTYGVSVDHIVLQKNDLWDQQSRRPREAEFRAELTSESAKEFIEACRRKRTKFTPIGALQFWSRRSAGLYAKRLVDAGYDYIGIGGLVGHKIDYIYDVICEIRSKIPAHVRLHIFGFAALSGINRFAGLDVTSFDSTSPLLKAFKDDKFSYFTPSKNYVALKIPQAFDNQRVRLKVQSGLLNWDRLSKLEQECLEKVRKYDRDVVSLESTLASILEYEKLTDTSNSSVDDYVRLLEDRPWRDCSCPVCKKLGIEVVIYRGRDRNKRRGFHNLYVFYEGLLKIRGAMNSLVLPCIRTEQNPNKFIYSFVVDGKEIPRFASVSRIERDQRGQLFGYQRPEVLDHINDIRTYLERTDSILPNSLVIAFQETIVFESKERINAASEIGTISISVDSERKPGWIVDGQQRSAAIRLAKRSSLPVSVVGFESKGPEEEREQFVLVNNTRPLPKSLVYELLPRIDGEVPVKLKKRREAYLLLDRINLTEGSPFYMRIKTTTFRHLETAQIKDVSVLKMIENSLSNGALYRYRNNFDRATELLINYWGAVVDLYPDAWDLSPRHSRLTHGVGIISMGYLMDAIAVKLTPRSGEVPEKGAFWEEVGKLGTEIPWTRGTWRFGKGAMFPWNELQNTSRHINLLTNYLVREYRGFQREAV